MESGSAGPRRSEESMPALKMELERFLRSLPRLDLIAVAKTEALGRGIRIPTLESPEKATRMLLKHANPWTILNFKRITKDSITNYLRRKGIQFPPLANKTELSRHVLDHWGLHDDPHQNSVPLEEWAENNSGIPRASPGPSRLISGNESRGIETPARGPAGNNTESEFARPFGRGLSFSRQFERSSIGRGRGLRGHDRGYYRGVQVDRYNRSGINEIQSVQIQFNRSGDHQDFRGGYGGRRGGRSDFRRGNRYSWSNPSLSGGFRGRDGFSSHRDLDPRSSASHMRERQESPRRFEGGDKVRLSFETQKASRPQTPSSKGGVRLQDRESQKSQRRSDGQSEINREYENERSPRLQICDSPGTQKPLKLQEKETQEFQRKFDGESEINRKSVDTKSSPAIQRPPKPKVKKSQDSQESQDTIRPSQRDSQMERSQRGLGDQNETRRDNGAQRSIELDTTGTQESQSECSAQNETRQDHGSEETTRTPPNTTKKPHHVCVEDPDKTNNSDKSLNKSGSEISKSDKGRKNKSESLVLVKIRSQGSGRDRANEMDGSAKGRKHKIESGRHDGIKKHKTEIKVDDTQKSHNNKRESSRDDRNRSRSPRNERRRSSESSDSWKSHKEMISDSHRHMSCHRSREDFGEKRDSYRRDRDDRGKPTHRREFFGTGHMVHRSFYKVGHENEDFSKGELPGAVVLIHQTFQFGGK